MRIRMVLFVLVLLLVGSVQPLAAQTDATANAGVAYPPPVYLLGGQFAVRGTANVPDMQAYFLEYRPLVDPVTPAGDSTVWSPATLPAAGPIIDDVLGVWDTTVLPDGLYELRLTVLSYSAAPVYVVVSPLRIENQPRFATPSPTPFPTQFSPTLPPPPTAVVSQNPTATATINANVRAGDGVSYAAIGFLLQGQSAPLVGVSSTGSGWWVISLPDERRGFVSPSVVQVTGDLSRLTSIVPPPLPTATPPPRPTATSRPLPDAVILGMRFNHDPRVNHDFNVIVTVANWSPTRLPRMSVACNFTPTNTFESRVIGTLDPFEQREITFRGIRLREGGGANFNAECAVDLNNLIAEISESNNYFTRTELLRN